MSYIPIDRALVPMQNWPSNNPPLVPNLQLLPEGEEVLVYVCSEVANEVTQRAESSPVRMYMYNIITENNWNNQTYIDAVQMTCDYVVYLYRQGRFNSPLSAIRDAVGEMMAMLSAALVVGDPNVQRQLTRDVVDDCVFNERQLAGYLQQFTDMYRQTRASTSGYQRPMTPVSHGVARANHRYGGGGAGIAGHSAARGGIMTRGLSTTAQPVAPARTSRFARRDEPGNPAVQTAAPAQNAAAPLAAPETLDIKGEIESMDRAKHNIVYFGRDFEVATGPLRRRFEEAVEAHEEIATSKEAVDATGLAGGSLEEMAVALRARCIMNEIRENRGLSIFHSLGYLITPVLSRVDHTDLFKRLESCGSFEQVAQVLVKDLDDRKGDELRYALTYTAQIDRLLTRRINWWFKAALNRPQTKIGSFIEDAPDLTNWLNTKFSSKYNTAYRDFQQGVLNTFFKYRVGSDPRHDVIEDFLDDYKTEGVYVQPLVENYAMIHISATANELGYQIDPNHHVVSAKGAPLLHRLMVAIEAVSKRSVKTAGNLIVTSDDVRYLASRVYDEKDTLFTLTEI